MISSHKKHQILESLNAMDQAQMDAVLTYVKSILQKPEAETSYEKFKRNAMKEIRQALKK
jgi:hypothetical protein